MEHITASLVRAIPIRRRNTNDFIALTNAVTVDFDGYFDSPKQWTYNYEVKQATVDYLALREVTPMTQTLKMQEQVQTQEETEMQEQVQTQEETEMQEQVQTQEETEMQVEQEPFQLRSHKTHKKDIKLQIPFREQKTAKHKGLRIAIFQKKENKYLDEVKKETEESANEETSVTFTEKQTTEDSTEIITLTSAITNEPRSIPYQIQYNVTLHTFTLQIMESGLKVFDEMKKKTTDTATQKKLDTLATSYEYKYKEFLDETYRQEIKTKLGTQKVIINAIEESDRLIKRLIENVVIEDTNNLRENIATIKNFKQEVRKETDHQFRNLCRDFRICRSADGFSEFLNDFLTTILRSDDSNIQDAIESLTEVIKTTDFKATFHKKTCKEIKESINLVQEQDFESQKTGLMIIKNIVANRNKPLSVKPSDLSTSRINSTIAFLDILDAFETKLLRSNTNVLRWVQLKTSLDAWEKGKRNDVDDIMKTFMGYLKTALNNMPSKMKDDVAENFSRFVDRH